MPINTEANNGQLQTPEEETGSLQNHLKVNLPLNSYKTSYGPLLDHPDDKFFIGRDKFLKSFVAILKNSRFDTGSYLISGYRGAGKTKAVEKALDNYIKGPTIDIPKWMFPTGILLISVIVITCWWKESPVPIDFLKWAVFDGLVVWALVVIVQKLKIPWSAERTIKYDKITFQSQNNIKVDAVNKEDKKYFWVTLKAKIQKRLKELYFVEFFPAIVVFKHTGLFKKIFNWLFIVVFFLAIILFKRIEPYKKQLNWFLIVVFFPAIIWLYLPFTMFGFVTALSLLFWSCSQHLRLMHGIKTNQFFHNIRNLFLPVVLIKVNLSFQPLKTNKVLYNIVSLLRKQLTSCIHNKFRLLLYWIGVIGFTATISHFQFVIFNNLHSDIHKSLNIFYPTHCDSNLNIPCGYHLLKKTIVNSLKNYHGYGVFKSERIDEGKTIPHWGFLQTTWPDYKRDKYYSAIDRNKPITYPIFRWVEASIGIGIEFSGWALNKNTSTYHFLVFLGIILIVHFLFSRILPTEHRMLRRLENLYNRMVYTKRFERKVSKGGFTFRWSKAELPLDERQIESELLSILEDCRDVFLPLPFIRPDIIFIFDEMDKIALEDPSNTENGFQDISKKLFERKKEVDQLLGALKTLLPGDKPDLFLSLEKKCWTAIIPIKIVLECYMKVFSAMFLRYPLF